MRSRGRKQRTLILSVLCCLLVFMGIGYSVFQSTLNIGGTSTALNTWDIRITSIEPTAKSDGATSVNKEIDVAGVSATFNATFTAPGDYIEYTVTVTNGGSIGAVLDSIIVEAVGDDADLFTYSNTAVQGQGLPGGESTTFKVRVDFNSSATRLPEGEVKFDLSLNYVQGEGTPGEGGGGDIPNPDDPSDWLFEVDENGEVVAYNYNSTLTETPQNVVVPATVGGTPVTTITEQSFIPKGNFSAYMDQTNMKIYALINEDNTVIVDTANNRTAVQVVGYKALMALTYEQCQGDASCLANYTGITYLCTDKNSCYAYTDETRTITASVPESGLSTLAENMYINPDPNVALEESIVTDLKANIETLDLSNATNLTTIEANALKGTGLTNVEFGDNSNITTIGDSAFANNELTSVEIPASVETIGESAFNGSGIQTLTFDTGKTVQNQLNPKDQYSLSRMGSTVSKLTSQKSALKSIGRAAFSGNAINSLILPEGLETIGESAFSDNEISGELVIPNGLTTIDWFAFAGNSITKLIIPESVNSIGYHVFDNNPIETLSIDKCVESFCSNTYFGMNIKTLIVKSGKISGWAFSANKISSLTLGEGVTSIGDYAFADNGITELVIPNSLTSLGSCAFENNQISELTLPKAITGLNTTTFSENPLETLTIGECDSTICVGDTYGNSIFGTKVKTLTINSGEIGDYAFYNKNLYHGITKLTLGDAVTTLGDYAFYGNGINGEVKIPDGITSVGDYAFDYNGITNLTIPQSLTTIGNSAFRNNAITELVVPSTVTTVGNYAFYGNAFDNLTIEDCTNICSGGTEGGKFGYNMKSLTINSGKIGDYAFKFPDNLSLSPSMVSLTLGDGVTSIGQYAFSGNAITELVVPETVSSIGNYAFEEINFEKLTFEKCVGCSNAGANIKELIIKSGEIGDQAFSYTAYIQNLTLEEGVTSIGERAFIENQIEKLAIPKTVTSIGENAFFNNMIGEVVFEPNNGLVIERSAFKLNQISGNLVLPEGLTSMGEQAFYGNQIVNLTIPSTVTSVGGLSFDDNPTLSSIFINRTEEDFLDNVTVDPDWYDTTLNPTIRYKEAQ